MGRIEYAINPKMDLNGNRVYYYRFLDDKGVDYTDYFKFIGRKTSWKKIKVIRSHMSPSELHRWFHSDLKLSFYSIPELARAQKDIDVCNNYKGCDTFCGVNSRQECRKVMYHNRCVSISRKVKDIIDSDENKYIEGFSGK